MWGLELFRWQTLNLLVVEIQFRLAGELAKAVLTIPSHSGEERVLTWRAEACQVA